MGIGNRTLPLLERLKPKTDEPSPPVSGAELASSSLAAARRSSDRVRRGGTLLGVGGTPKPKTKAGVRTAVPRTSLLGTVEP